jgi:hypothetical protein
METVRREVDDTKVSGPTREQLGPTAFGLGLLGDLTPPGAWVSQVQTAPFLQLELVAPQAIADSWSGLDAIGWEGVIDDAPFLVERGLAGDHRFVHGLDPVLRNWSGGHGELPHGALAIHHLSADASVLQCVPANHDEPLWWRVVLDSVLFTVALLRGYEALHAGALATPDGVIAIAATTGGGKSTLVAELLGRGLTLMADDVLVLQPASGDDRPLAHPAPPLMTVPTERVRSLREVGSVEPIASLPGECWLSIPVHPQPLPLKALVILNRRPNLATGMRRADDPLGTLLSSLLRFPNTPERERARFELAGAISTHVPIWRLDADPSVDPDRLAALLMAKLVDPAGPWASGLATIG